MRNDAGWGRRISKETTTHGFFAEKVKNKAGERREKSDCVKYALSPRAAFPEKVKIKVGGGTVERTEKVYIKKQNPSEKSQGDNRMSKNESCIKLLGKIAKERAKKCFGKTKPPGMIRGELFTVFFLLTQLW